MTNLPAKRYFFKRINAAKVPRDLIVKRYRFNNP